MHDGFLLDPESETARYFTTDAKPFSSISCVPCLVLLGDPGLGKSHELRAEYNRVREAGGRDDVALRFELRDFTSEDRLEKRLFGCSEMLDWFQSNKRLHLFLDGFDEGLLRVDTISRILVSGFSSLPRTRLDLRIASRPLEWQVTFENDLKRLWDKDMDSKDNRRAGSSGNL